MDSPCQLKSEPQSPQPTVVYMKANDLSDVMSKIGSYHPIRDLQSKINIILFSY